VRLFVTNAKLVRFSFRTLQTPSFAIAFCPLNFVIAVDISQPPKDYPLLQDFIGILKQSLRIMRQSILEHELAAAQIVIRPAIGKIPKMDLSGKQEIIKTGEDAAITAIPQIREWIQKIANEKKITVNK
jgi:NTE family protein